MDWIWLLLPVGLIAGLCGGLWIRSRVRNHAAGVAGVYGASATQAPDRDSDASGSSGDGGGGD